MNEWEWSLLEAKSRLDSIEVAGVTIRPGDRVRLHPEEGGDILDLALQEQIAIVESIEEDYESNAHICVVLESDPGRDMGMMRQTGHRFFFTPSEVEPFGPLDDSEMPASEREAAAKPSILIAGIGNIFFGDDAFGVEVARKMLSTPQAGGVRVVDFGIRGLDLAYALQDGYETAILVDAYPHGQKPGTVSVLEPDLSELDRQVSDIVQPHAMNPMNVLRMAKAIQVRTRQILLVGCEPKDLGAEDGRMGLSDEVTAAVDQAVATIGVMVTQILAGQNPDRHCL